MRTLPTTNRVVAKGRPRPAGPGDGPGQAEDAGRSAAPAAPPLLTFGPSQHEAEALVVPFLQDGHLVVNDVIADRGKQGGVRRTLPEGTAGGAAPHVHPDQDPRHPHPALTPQYLCEVRLS